MSRWITDGRTCTSIVAARSVDCVDCSGIGDGSHRAKFGDRRFSFGSKSPHGTLGLTFGTDQASLVR